jgi:rhodanese-related sulfurtransferase
MKHAPAFLALVEEVLTRTRECGSAELIAMQENNEAFILFDVREDHEWQQGRIKGAQHLGRGILERDIENTVPNKDTTLVLYCGGGYRSALAADSLQKMGYANVLSLRGGWREWKEKSYPQAL